MKNLILTSKLAVVGAAALMAVSARADIIDYTLGVQNGFTGSPGPYGSVQVNLTDPTHATVTFTADAGFYFIDSGIVGVNVNAAGFSVGSLSGFSASASVGSGNEDGFGSFNVSIDNGPASVHETLLSFVLTDTSGTWGSASGVLTGNNNSYLVAGHMYDPAANNGNGNTGYVANGQTTVPDGGSTLVLLGLAGLGLFAFVRKIRTA